MKQPWLAALLAASILILSASSAGAQWTWLNPTPHGNNLYDVTYLTNQTAIAVGDLGTIMVTHDGSLTWRTLFRTNSVASKLRRIDRVDDNTAVVVGDNGVILKTYDGGDNWSSISSGTTTSLLEVSFAGTTGIIVDAKSGAPHVMLRSTNGGDTWTPVAGAPSPVYALDMATPLVAYCRTQFTIYKSQDGGLTWSALPNPPNANSFGGFHTPISFADATSGVMTVPASVADGQKNVFVTHNGGASWTQQVMETGFSETSVTISDIEYQSSLPIVASVVQTTCDTYSGNCANTGLFFRSTTEGASWTYENGVRGFNGVAINSGGVILNVGNEGEIVRTTGPGDWTQIAGQDLWFQPDDTGQLAFRNSQEGIVMGSQWDQPLKLTALMHTGNGGYAWNETYWGQSEYGSMQDVTMPAGSSDVYAIGTQQPTPAPQVSLLLKSSDDGQTWTPVFTAAQDLALRAIEFGSPTHGVAVGPNSRALVIDGSNVTVVTIPAGIANVAFADASTVVAVGTGLTASRVMRSTDGGTTWAPVASPAAPYLDVAFPTPSIGVAVGVNGAIARSIDGGITWTTVTSPTSNWLYAVSIDAGGYGLAVGDAGTVIETSNKGASWGVLSAPTSAPLTDVTVFGAHHALVAGPEMMVLEYRENTIPTLFASFKAVPRKFSAELSWDVSTDEKLASFSVLRTCGTDQRVVASGLPITARSFVDKDLVPGQRYQYELLAFDKDGSYTQSQRVTITAPAAVAELLPNQPNPFNPVTTIRFVVPEKMRVTISVHDVAGRVVATLLDEVREPGSHEITWNANGMASGVYFAKLRAGKTEVSRKMVLLK